jgi:hypothetical protein
MYAISHVHATKILHVELMLHMRRCTHGTQNCRGPRKSPQTVHVRNTLCDLGLSQSPTEFLNNLFCAMDWETQAEQQVWFGKINLGHMRR